MIARRRQHRAWILVTTVAVFLSSAIVFYASSTAVLVLVLLAGLGLIIGFPRRQR